MNKMNEERRETELKKKDTTRLLRTRTSAFQVLRQVSENVTADELVREEKTWRLNFN